MLQFQVSRRLAQRMNLPLSAAELSVDCDSRKNDNNFQWTFYGHILSCNSSENNKLTVVVMEVETRYAFLFTDLTDDCLSNLSSLLLERLRLEFKQLFDKKEIAKLDSLFLMFSEISQISLVRATNRSVQSHIRQVGRELDLTRSRLARYPSGFTELYDFSRRANHMLRKSFQQDGYFYPMTKMIEKIERNIS